MAGDLLHDGDGTFSGELDGPGWERTPWHATQRAAWEGAEECEMNRDGATISSASLVIPTPCEAGHDGHQLRGLDRLGTCMSYPTDVARSRSSGLP
jgi:hypothetical protein